MVEIRKTGIVFLSIILCVSSFDVIGMNKSQSQAKRTKDKQVEQSQPSFKDSWYKIATFRWNELSMVDRNNIIIGSIAAIATLVVGCGLIFRIRKSSPTNDVGLVSRNQANYIRINDNCQNIIYPYLVNRNIVAATHAAFRYLTQENSPEARRVLEECLQNGQIMDFRASYGIV